MSNLFQDQRTGKLVEFINKHDKEYAMVRDSGGNINYVNLDSLVPYDKQKGRLTKVDAPQLVVEKEEEFDTEIPDEEAEKITTVQQAIDYINKNLK